MIGDKEKSQIDMYDVFGYLAPGFMLLSSLIVTASLIHNDISILPLYVSIKDATAPIFIALTILALALSYMLGHMIATLAEMVFERIFVEEIFGYPYRKLVLGAPKKNNNPSADFYRVLISLFIIIGFTVTAFPYLHREATAAAQEWIYLLLKFFLALVAIRWVERMISHQFRFKKGVYVWLNGKASRLSAIEPELKVVRKYAFNFPLKLCSIPFSIAEGFLRNFLRLDNPLSPRTREKFIELFKKEFGIDIVADEVGTDIYWLTYWKVTEDSEHLRDRLYKFLSLYGMTRNASAALFMSAIIFSLPNYYFSEPNAHLALMSILLYLSSGIMSLRYYYLYYNYYSKSLFRAFVSLKS